MNARAGREPARALGGHHRLLPVIAMIIFIKYPHNDQRFKQIRDETEARKRTVIKAHNEDPKTFVTSNYAG